MSELSTPMKVKNPVIRKDINLCLGRVAWLDHDYDERCGQPAALHQRPTSDDSGVSGYVYWPMIGLALGMSLGDEL